jgi:hypothetical protein
MSFIWAMLVSCAISYVLSSMAGDPFVLSHALILGVIITIAVYILGEGLLKEKSSY